MKPSKKTAAALAVLRTKKLNLFEKIVIFVAALVFVTFEVSLLSALNRKTEWKFFLEFNGVALSMFGALWTALGARLSQDEKAALMDIKKNSSVVLEELIHSLSSASRFASVGAYCILAGGLLLCIKLAVFG